MNSASGELSWSVKWTQAVAVAEEVFQFLLHNRTQFSNILQMPQSKDGRRRWNSYCLLCSAIFMGWKRGSVEVDAVLGMAPPNYNSSCQECSSWLSSWDRGLVFLWFGFYVQIAFRDLYRLGLEFFLTFFFLPKMYNYFKLLNPQNFMKKNTAGFLQHRPICNFFSIIVTLLYFSSICNFSSVIIVTLFKVSLCEMIWNNKKNFNLYIL